MTLVPIARRWLPPAILVAAAVVFRGWFFAAWEESYFDSDQAIVGLMAKHLAELRSFPLYFYGQDYMLGVEAWIAAPVFAVFGASVATLRATLILINIVTALLLVRLLVTQAGLHVWTAVLAASTFWMAPFVTAAHLVEAQGGNAEPFLWILVLWTIRRSPWWLGGAFGIMTLHREFTLYAAPMLIALQVASPVRRWSTIARAWSASAVSFAGVVIAVAALKPYVDLMGPDTSGVPAMTPGSTVSLLLARVNVDADRLPARAVDMLTDYVPVMLGLTRFEPLNVAIFSETPVGWDLLLWPVVGLTVLASACWLVYWLQRREWPDGTAFPVYLIGVGATAAVVYVLTRDLSMGTFRYGLLALFLPVGLAALLLRGDGPRLARWPVGLALLLMASGAAVDHAAVLQGAVTRPPPRRLRAVADHLVSRAVSVAEASYWRAYVITFLTGERVKVASTFSERILEYRRLADEQGASLTRVSDSPCAGERVASWYICRE